MTSLFRAAGVSAALLFVYATPISAAVPPKGSQTTQTTTQAQTAAQTAVQAPVQAPPLFGASAVFPEAAIVGYDERRDGNTPNGTLTLTVRNKGNAQTDPAWLKVDDHSLLMMQSTAPVAIPALKPGASQTVILQVKARLNYTTKAEWSDAYDQACGADFRLILDWRGPVAQTPMGEHQESQLKETDGRDQPGRPICDDTQCVVPCDVVKRLKLALDGHAVGYAYFVGRDPGFFNGAGGSARTKADGFVAFTPDTKITVASVSKLVTAIAAVRLLDAKGVSLDAGIGPKLPAGFTPGAFVKAITYRQLLSQTSGIKDYGNIQQTYAALNAFYSAPVNPAGSTPCPVGVNPNPLVNPINPNNTSYCYSNYNFAIFRLLLPAINGDAPDPSLATRPQTLADQYIGLVQQNEFHEVGLTNVSCAKPSGDYAYAYLFPGGAAKGGDWGDNSLICGAAGWYLSVNDMAKVMSSLVNKDGRVLKPALFETMKASQLGFDKTQRSSVSTYPEFEKNGLWSANCPFPGSPNCERVSTSIAVFGPGVVGILFLNSDVSGGAESGKGAAGVLEDAYYGSLKPKPAP